MANTLRDILADVRTAIEALTPKTDATKTYRVIDSYRFGGDAGDIPANVAHRTVAIVVDNIAPLQSISGATHIMMVSLRLRLFHDWKRDKSLEAQTIQTEDVRQLVELFRFKRPGNGNGARIWASTGQSAPVIDGPRWETNLSFEGNIGIPSVVDP